MLSARKNCERHRVVLILTVISLIGTAALKPIGFSSAQAIAPGWSQTGNLTGARVGHTATLLPGGKVLVAGGFGKVNDNSTELYDPATGRWSVTGNLKVARARLTATLLPNGKVLVAGGHIFSTQTPTNTAELYDPATGSWSLTGNMNQSRAWHSATLLRNGKVLIAGGYGLELFNSAELYDPETGSWTMAGPLNQGRLAHTATLLQNGRVLIAGGTDSIYSPFTVDEEYGPGLISAELYDPSTGSWTVTGSLHTGRLVHTATLLLNGNVLAAGGGRSAFGLLYDMSDTAELYSPTTGTWSYTGNLSHRAYHTATLLPNGSVLAVGGEATEGILNNAEIYDPGTGNWRTTVSLNAARYLHTATLLSNGKVLVAGGGNRSSSAELYDSGGFLDPNPIDDPQFFVRQHYRDFLNREPDPDGLNFWSGEILLCGSDPQCIEVKRINDSAAFFLSIEFQQTGYLVYRMYKASYGNLPNAPVPITLNEFLPDAQEIGRGVIVGQTGWEQLLENNKQTFTAAFVQRQRFVAAYPTSLSPDDFVDALFANAGVTPSDSERASAIAEFGGASTTGDAAARAGALRCVAENSTLAQQELNRAFVLMQYFGYLRRNPNDAPERTLDFQGYNFWLNKLNSFDGDFVQAEMVKAFITSAEYRNRFGS